MAVYSNAQKDGYPPIRWHHRNDALRRTNEGLCDARYTRREG